jgi:carbon monoxide dehydrogenase subunit G
MKLEQSFTVAAPVEQVWAALIDVERVAPCLPGAEITGSDESGAYHGTFTVKLGPTTASYNGTLHLEEVDEAAHAVVMSARGTDKRGQGAARPRRSARSSPPRATAPGSRSTPTSPSPAGWRASGAAA